MSSSHFDSIATVYDESLPAHVVEHYLDKRTRFVIDNCPVGDALDVGCGTGALAARLAAAGYAMSGVDPSEGMLEVLRERSPQVHAVQGRARPDALHRRQLRSRPHRGRTAPHREPDEVGRRWRRW